MPIESTETFITTIPSAVLPDLDGQHIALDDYCRNGVSVVFFSCNHCPYVQWIEQEVARLSQLNSAVRWIAICSNDVDNYPEDDIIGLKSQVERAGWDFPYLVDSDQRVAHLFGAVCTPDFFVFDAAGLLVYRGAFDQSRPNSDLPVNGEYLSQAIAAAERCAPYSGGRPSMGCGIKWTE